MWTGDLDGFEVLRDSVDAALALARRLRRPGRRRLRRVRAPLARRARATRAGATPATRSLHADGSPAHGPIALAETQGYVYYAKRRLAAIYGQLGDVERAERLTTGGARAQAPLQRALLDGGRGLLRHGARRREAAGQDGRARPSATASGRASSPTSTCRPSSSASWRPTCSPAGACARCSKAQRATTR